MIYATISGNLGRDAEIRSVGNDSVCSFSVASGRKVKGKDETTWVDCSIWGKRGTALSQHLSKGTRVVVVGELSTREHNGKTYLQIKVAEIDLMGGGNKGGGKRDHAPQTDADDEPGYARHPVDDKQEDFGEIPF